MQPLCKRPVNLASADLPAGTLNCKQFAMSTLTHFDAQGQAHMVDVAAKASTHRIGIAGGRIEMLPTTLALIESGTAKKGDVCAWPVQLTGSADWLLSRYSPET